MATGGIVIDALLMLAYLGYGAAILWVLSLSNDIASPPETPEPPPAKPTMPRWSPVCALVARASLHRDPDLSLARRLGVPAKTLLTAMNRHWGENVSRLIGAVRIPEASAHLRAGASVTQAMLDAGFNIKSTVNREFRRITGQSPTDRRG